MITFGDVVNVNKVICEECKEPHVVINETNILSALSVQQWYTDDRLLASALVRSLSIGHGFQDGNKRTAAVIGNSVCPFECSEEDLIDCVISIVTGKLKDVESIATILYTESFDGR